MKRNRTLYGFMFTAEAIVHICGELLRYCSGGGGSVSVRKCFTCRKRIIPLKYSIFSVGIITIMDSSGSIALTLSTIRSCCKIFILIEIVNYSPFLIFNICIFTAIEANNRFS